jgi:hypothetical protein
MDFITFFKKILKEAVSNENKNEGVNMKENTIVRFRQLKDGKRDKILQQEGNIDKIRGFNLEDDDKLIIEFDNGEKLGIKYQDLKKALNNDSLYMYEQYKNLDLFLEIANHDEDFLKDLKEIDIFNDLEFPEIINFFDITDKEFNEFGVIRKSDLQSPSGGLWIGSGKRFIQLEVNKTISEILKKDKKSTLRLVLTRKNNKEIEELTFSINKRNLVLKLDTDKFIDYFDENEEKAFFYGYVILDFEIGDEKYSFLLNFEINMRNPLFSVKNTNIGVDFGTSSTCIAKDGGKELVAFTDNPESIEDRENATSIIIFNWKKFYNEWVNKNVTMPHFVRSDSSKHAEEVDYQKEHYNYSNYIKQELKEAPNSKTINAIISEIKLIPEELENDRKNKRVFIPFDRALIEKDVISVVSLTDDIEEEGKDVLNPIALYGYLIGRAINRQARNEIYTNYLFTMPVKFSKNQKKAILDSLGYGIKRALPLWVRDKVEIKESYPESVALLGSAKKLKQFRLKEIEEEAYPFAVFDFGGGTLDFAFGIYRKPVRDERAIEELGNEIKFKDIIEVFRIDGMNLGGEKIIDRLSYLIYEHNKDLMKENNIPIMVPENEKEIYNFPDELLKSTHIARLNLKNISEQISREFFINNDVQNDIIIELFSVEEVAEEVILTIPKEDLEEKLNDILYEAVENFKYVLESTFKEFEWRLQQFGHKNFNINKVKIFQAGNASRNENLQKIFKEIFKEHDKIVFLKSDDSEEERKKITPKNAVARGVLFLSNNGYYYYQQDEKGGLDRYIWFIEDIEEDMDEAEARLKKGDTFKRDFELISRIDLVQKEFKVHYSDVAKVEDEDDDRLLSIPVKLSEDLINENWFFVYAKPHYDKYLEIKFGDEEEPKSDSYILDLDKSEIKKKMEI